MTKMDPDEVIRIRMRFKEALNAGFNKADASAYANDELLRGFPFRP
jgi:hypothetical protein